MKIIFKWPKLIATTDIVEVYHNKEFTIIPHNEVYFEDLSLVAHVSFAKDAEMEDALERAFIVTQNLEWPWAERPVVDSISATKPFVKKGRSVCYYPRSTSVGDIMRIENVNHMKTPLWWRVENVGFKNIDSPTIKEETISE